MIKIFTVLAASMALGAVAAPTKGSESGQSAIEYILDQDLATVNGSVGVPLDSVQTLYDYAESCSNNYIVLVDSILSTDMNGNDKKVKINWVIDSDKSLYVKSKPDKEHTLIEFNYPTIDEQDVFFDFHIKNFKCGGTKLVPEEGEFCYRVNLAHQMYKYDSYTVSEVVHVTDYKFDVVDYEQDSPWYRPNNDNSEYHFMHVRGKVTYLAPDGNWGLIADGDSYLEFYAGAGTPLNSAYFSALKVGNWVELQGNLSTYNGNMQLSFISGVKKLSNHKGMKNPTRATKLNEESIKNIAGCQAIPNLMNSMRTVKGRFVEGTLKEGDAFAPVPNQIVNVVRYTFNLQVGSQIIRVDYDYHVSRDLLMKTSAKDEVITYLNKVLANPGKEFKITGTMRWVSTNKEGSTNNGMWVITPLPKSANGGCAGSVLAVSGLSAFGTTLGAVLLLLKKRKED